MEIKTTRDYWVNEVEKIIDSKICLTEKKEVLQDMVNMAIDTNNLEVKNICESVLMQLTSNCNKYLIVVK